MALTKITGEGVGAVDSLGVGTSSPSSVLHLSTSDDPKITLTDTGFGASADITGSNGNLRLNSTTATLFDMAGSEVSRINSSGTLLIGKTSDTTTTEGHVLGYSGYLHTTRSGAVAHILNRTTSNGIVVQYRRDNTAVGSVSVTASATSYNTSSDYRLKENVTADWDATTRLKQLNPVRFNFIADADTTVDGFLAHEVQSIVPEAITGTKDEVDDDGNPVMQGIDQSKIVPLLVKTIIELEARIVALETA